jgi:hypothetical protein
MQWLRHRRGLIGYDRSVSIPLQSTLVEDGFDRISVSIVAAVGHQRYRVIDCTATSAKRARRRRKTVARCSCGVCLSSTPSSWWSSPTP